MEARHALRARGVYRRLRSRARRVLGTGPDATVITSLYGDTAPLACGTRRRRVTGVAVPPP